MMDYNFFDYKGFIKGYEGQDFFSLPHIIFMILATIAIVVICILCRNIKKEKLELFIKILAIVIPVLEVVKIVWESYWDITTGVGFNWTGLLPLYTCSMFIFVLPFAAWGKGEIKDYAICWLGTINIFAGLTNFYITNILFTYPFFTFATYMSLQYHFLMVVTGLLIVISKYREFDWKDAIKGFIPLAIFSIPVIPIDYIIEADYMLYYFGSGAPLLPEIANGLGSIGLRWIYTILMIFGYLGLSYLMIAIYKGINKVKNFLISKRH